MENTISSETVLKYEAVAQELSRKIIAGLTPGSKLPPMRRLMADLKTSQATLDRALRLLWENGEITRIDGAGYFTVIPDAVSEKSNGQWTPVDFCFFFRDRVMGNPLYSKLLSLLMEYGRNYHFRINIFPYEEMGTVQGFQDKLLRSGSRGAILLGCSKSSFEYALRRLEIPSVHLYPNWVDEQSHSVMIDNYRCIETLIASLTELGHRNIAMLHGQGYDNCYMTDQEERIDAYYEIVRRYGLPVVPQNVLFGGYSDETGYKAVKELMTRSDSMRPTAIMANDYNITGVYRAIREAGLKPGKDISVTGFDNLDTAPLLNPSLSSLDISCEEAIRAALERLRLRMDKPETEGGIIRVKPRFIKRDSIQPCRTGISSQDKKIQGGVS